MNQTTPTEPTAYQLKNLYIYLEGGLPLRLAANSVGVTEATVRAWMQQNPEIEIRVGAAEAHFQLRCLDAIVSARDRRGNLNVRAMMFLLQARFPEQFNCKQSRKTAAKSAAQSGPPSPPPADPHQTAPQPAANGDVTATKPATTVAASSTPIQSTKLPGHNAPSLATAVQNTSIAAAPPTPDALQTPLAKQTAIAA